MISRLVPGTSALCKIVRLIGGGWTGEGCGCALSDSTIPNVIRTVQSTILLNMVPSYPRWHSSLRSNAGRQPYHVLNKPLAQISMHRLQTFNDSTPGTRDNFRPCGFVLRSWADHWARLINVRYWPKVEIPGCTAHVRFRGKADMSLCTAYVCF